MGQVVRSVRSLVTEAAVAMVSPYTVAAATEFVEHKSVSMDMMVENGPVCGCTL